MTDGERGEQREQRADREEHHARDHSHVISRDRQHVAEPGNEHRIIDRLGDSIAAPGQQRGRDRAPVAVEHIANPRVDRVAQVLHDGGITEQKSAARRRLLCLDRAHHEAGGADALKIQVATEIVATGPQRRERRLQAGLQFDEAPNFRRGALPHRQPHPLEFCLRARALHRGDAQDEAVGAFTDVAGLDEACESDRKHRPRQHAMRDPRGLPGRGGKAGRNGCDHHNRGKHLLPPQQNGCGTQRNRDDGGDRQHRLMIGGEVEGDPGAECDRHPGQQPPGTRLRASPLTQRFSERRP